MTCPCYVYHGEDVNETDECDRHDYNTWWRGRRVRCHAYGDGLSNLQGEMRWELWDAVGYGDGGSMEER